MPESDFPQTSVAEARHDLTGSTVGRFAIRGRVGGGGMGEVYQAEDTTLKRRVALKRVTPQLRADAGFRRRLLKEAERAAQLTNQHIASVYDVLEEQGELFLVMEYVEGGTLRERLRDRLGIEEFVDLAIQCGEALVAAAAKGIVHRDLKPENIMLTPQNQVKVLDFGIARRLPAGTEGSLTQTLESIEQGNLSGTPGYMAPEVFLDRPSDGRADLFSLGVIFYECLTGRHPFASDSLMDTATRVLRDEPPPLRKLNPRVPPELERVVTKLLAKDPVERYATAADMVVDLRSLQRQGIRIGGPVAVPKPWRRAVWKGAAVLGVGALLVALTPWMWRLVSNRLERGSIPAEKQLVVLPFTNIGVDPSNQAFSDGLVETLSSKLTQLEQFQGSLWVVPASEVRSRGLSSVDAARKAFGVNLALTGSVQRVGENVRVTANLVDATTLRQLRSTVLDARLADVSVWQDDAIVRLAQMLEVELQPQARQLLIAGGTAVPGAYEFYLQGRGYLQRHEKKENIESAIALFERALEQDGRYALAYAGLGEAYWRKYSFTKDARWVAEAQQSCRRALALNQRLAPVHVTLGMLFTETGQYQDGVKEFRQALSLDPANADAYRELARAFEAMGRLEEAEATYQKAIALRPGYWAGYHYLGVLYYRHGRYHDAAAQFQRVIELTPDNVRGYYSLGGLYHLMGRTDEAIALMKKSLALEPTGYAYSNLGTLYFFQGRYSEAVGMFEKALELEPNDYLVQGNLGDAYRWTPEQREKAGPAYRRAIELAKRELRVNPRDPQAWSDVALYRAKLGESQPALEAIAAARREAPRDVNVLFRATVVYHLAGQQERALDTLAEAVRAGYSVAEIRKDPELAELRSHPRYTRLLETESSRPVDFPKVNQ